MPRVEAYSTKTMPGKHRVQSTCLALSFLGFALGCTGWAIKWAPYEQPLPQDFIENPRFYDGGVDKIVTISVAGEYKRSRTNPDPLNLVDNINRCVASAVGSAHRLLLEEGFLVVEDTAAADGVLEIHCDYRDSTSGKLRFGCGFALVSSETKDTVVYYSSRGPDAEGAVKYLDTVWRSERREYSSEQADATYSSRRTRPYRPD